MDGEPLLDLDYEEDYRAEVDFNVVMTDRGDFVEVQGTAEEGAFPRRILDEVLIARRVRHPLPVRGPAGSRPPVHTESSRVAEAAPPMSIEYRLIAEDELQAASEVQSLAFGGHFEPSGLPQVREWFELGDYLGAFDGPDPVGMTLCFPFEHECSRRERDRCLYRRR